MFDYNITLIGMPGCGKSTLGIVVAKMLCKNFIDTDILIQGKTGSRLGKIISEIGNDGFLKLENSTISEINVHNALIATGGSAVFGKEAMAHLKSISTVVYLRAPYETIERRLGDLARRGVVLEPGQTLRDIYELRTPLYEKYADIIVDCTEYDNIEEMATKIADLFAN